MPLIREFCDQSGILISKLLVARVDTSEVGGLSLAKYLIRRAVRRRMGENEWKDGEDHR